MMKHLTGKLAHALLISSAMTISTVTWSGNIYTWTDENGTQHFGERPPNGVRDFTLLQKGRIGRDEPQDAEATSPSETTRPTGAAAKTTDSRTTNRPAPAPQSQAQPGTSDKTDLDTRQASIEKQLKEVNCERARNRIKTLSESARFTTTNDQGETVTMTAEEVEAQRKQAQQVAADNC